MTYEDRKTEGGNDRETERKIERNTDRHNERKTESMSYKALNDTIDGDLEMN